MTITIHHATAKKALSLNILDLHINAVSGNAECTWEGDLYEHESAKGLISLIADAEGDNEEKETEARGELENCIVDPEALGEENGDDEDENRSVVKAKYKARYKPHHDRCGDDMAKAFSAYITHQTTVLRKNKKGVENEVVAARVDEVKLVEVCEANDVDLSRWAGKNMGMVRMNVGNVLRGKLRRGGTVVIGLDHFAIKKGG